MKLFESIAKIELPRGGSYEQLKQLDLQVQALEDCVFSWFPELIEASIEKQNRVIYELYEKIHTIATRS
jgi:hypothetical protein